MGKYSSCIKSNPCNLPTKFDNVDIVTFRENTEDLYVGKEKQIDENTSLCL